MMLAHARLGALLVAGLLVAPVSLAQNQRWEHRVVVPTTALGYDEDLSASLERRVNALGARGFHVAALVGGEGVVLDRMLRRRAYVNGLADDSSVIPVVMARPLGGAAVAREYRLLHLRQNEEIATVVAPLGAAGYRLVAAEFEGGVVHLAFERSAGAQPVEYREFRNRNRRTWMEHLLADADVRARMTRVQPVAGDAGIVELGPAQPTPGDVSWLNTPEHDFASIEGRVRELASTGYRVDLVRRRGNLFDVLMLKPAGVSSSAGQWDLDDGPWGSACARGHIAGAAVGPDGDVVCATDSGGGSTPANRGLDLTVRPQSTAKGAVLFRAPTCDLLVRSQSTRPAAARVAFALQFERELARAAADGFRVTRALAASDSKGLDRIVTFTTDAPLPSPPGLAGDRSVAPYLFAELDLPGSGRDRPTREAALNAALAQHGLDSTVWIELSTVASANTALLLGCAPTQVDRFAVADKVRQALQAHDLGSYRINNELVIGR